MGNYTFITKNIPKPNDIVTIKHDKYSVDAGIENEVLGIGKKAKVLKTVKLYQSRPNEKPVYVSKVVTQDKKIDAYFVTNLQ